MMPILFDRWIMAANKGDNEIKYIVVWNMTMLRSGSLPVERSVLCAHNTHINKVTKRANSTLAFVRRNLRHCQPKLKEMAFASLVRSVL